MTDTVRAYTCVSRAGHLQAGQGAGPMQQTAVLPNSFPAMRPSVLVSSSGHWVFWAVGAVRFEGDAAGRCLPDVMSHNAALLCLYTFRSLRGGPNGSRPWCLEVMQQTAVLPDVNACGAAISAVKVPAMPVGRSRLGGNAAVLFCQCHFLRCIHQCL